MAKQRIVNTRFWDDSYIARLSSNEKLLFLYLLTNPLTTIAGVYELSLKRAAFDTGLTAKEISALLAKLEADGKIIRQDDWIGLVNFIRHQSLNPKVRQGIVAELAKAPHELINRLPTAASMLSIGFHSLSLAYDRLSHSNPNSNTNLNPKASPREEFSPNYPPEIREGVDRLVRRVRWRG